jgi:hypothetical protein
METEHGHPGMVQLADGTACVSLQLLADAVTVPPVLTIVLPDT